MNLPPINYDQYRNWIFPARSDLLISRSFDEITFLSGLLESDGPLYLSKRDQENYWYTYLEDSRTLYIQYNFVLGTTPSGETMSQFVREIESFLEQNVVDKVIVDLRHNPGGNNNTYKPFLDFLSQNDHFNISGHLFTIIGRNTFSAATNFAADLEQSTNTIFVGEGTGGSPNLYGDTTKIILPNSRLSVEVSTRYWEKSTPDDNRTSIEPDYAVGLSAEEYFEKNDPQLDFILQDWTYEIPESITSQTLPIGDSDTSNTQSTSSDTSRAEQGIYSIVSSYLTVFVLSRFRSILKNGKNNKPF